MKEYHKIETVFARDMEGTKKLIIGQYRNPLVEILKDVQWVATEKIDGTNVRIYWDGHKVSYAGRTERAELHKDLKAFLESKFCTPEAEQVFEQLFGEKEVYLFGEGYGAGIQKAGTYYIDDKQFIMFDVCVNGYWLDKENVRSIAKAFDVKCVSVVKTGTLAELIDYVRTKPKSVHSIDPDLEMEGVVAQPCVETRDQSGNRVVVKIKVCDFE